MKRIVYIVTISFFLSSNISFSMQPSLSLPLTTREMCILACIAAGCGALYLLRCWVRNTDERYEKTKQEIEQAKQRIKKAKPFIAPLTSEKEPQKIEKKQCLLTPEDIKKITENRQIRQQKKNDDVTEFHKACLDNDVQTVKKLLEEGCTHINETCGIMRKVEGYGYYPNRATPLHIAINNENNAIIDLLLTHEDIDFSIVDERQNTPVCYACQQNDVKTVKKLLAHKNIQFTDAKALWIACHGGYKEIVILLLQYNKDHDNCMKINDRINNKSNNMDAPLLEACHQIRQCALKGQKGENDRVYLWT